MSVRLLVVGDAPDPKMVEAAESAFPELINPSHARAILMSGLAAAPSVGAGELARQIEGALVYWLLPLAKRGDRVDDISNAALHNVSRDIAESLLAPLASAAPGREDG